MTYKKAMSLALMGNFTYDPIEERLLAALSDSGFIVGTKGVVLPAVMAGEIHPESL